MRLLKPLIEIEFKDEKELIEKLIDKSRNKSFEDYSEYLKTKGLIPEEAKAVKKFLDEFCEKTGYVWEPGSCRYIPKLCELGNEILQKSTANKYFTQIVLKNYMDGHFFLFMLARDGRKFVIDPTGVPVEEKSWVFPDDIRPYFGLVEHAAKFHKIVYQNK